jgi:hypothetical protein
MKVSDIVNQKIAIHCGTKEIAISLLDIISNKGYNWTNGRSFIQTRESSMSGPRWEEYKIDTCYVLVDTGVQFANITYFNNHGYSVIEAEDFIKDSVSILHINYKK